MLSEEEQRWTLVGIAFTKVLAPALRKVVATELGKWHHSLCQPPDEIHKQVFAKHKKLPPSKQLLQYQNINNNGLKTASAYDYAVKDPLSLAKLFLKEFMAHCTGFDETMDMSALLTIMGEAAPFVSSGAAAEAKKMRSDIRNPWAHCNISEWKVPMFNDSFHAMESLVKKISLPAVDEKRICDKLDFWKQTEILVDGRHAKLVADSVAELCRCIKNWNLDVDSKVNAVVLEKFEHIQSKLLDQHAKKLDQHTKELDQHTKELDQHSKELGHHSKALELQGNKIERIEKKVRTEYHYEQTESCLPDRLLNFTARVAEIQKVISFLEDDKTAVVCLHGGPGFGKTSIAIEVSHKLSEDHDIRVIFSELASATNVDEMISQLCLAVGVNHEDEKPKLSLILWLKNIRSKVVFVMDDIENQIHCERNHFYEFIRWLRTNSNQKCQIVTTSRTYYKIPKLENGDVRVEEMDVEACIQLMEQICPDQKLEYLQELAELCGKMPLAMCIAASLIDDFEDPDELLQELKEHPMTTLDCPETDENVQAAIDISYKRCSDEAKETLVRLAVFEGSFSKEAAKAVIEKENDKILKCLFLRSLIKQPTKHRYAIHLLIKDFLVEQRHGENEIEKRANEQAMRAEVLMVKYYLQLGHDLTMKSYSKDGYKESREALKKEANHIQNVFKICCEQNNPTTSEIPECLEQSEVYTTSARHFSLFVRTIIPGPIIDKFLQHCADMAKGKQQHAIKINFDCLLADQERFKSICKSDELYHAKMEELAKEFEAHKEDLKEEKSLWAFYCYQYGRYVLKKSYSEEKDARLQLQIRAREQLEQSLQLRQTLTETSLGTADVVHSLSKLGRICKNISTTEYHLYGNTNKCKNSSKQAEEYYNKAIELSQESLGEHELTSSCHKLLGDLFFTPKNAKQAEEEYKIAKEMRENLDLNANERHVNLLTNLGRCLTMCKRATEAIEILESARDMAEKLAADSDESNVRKTLVYAALAIAFDLAGENSNAVDYVNKAQEFKEALHKRDLKKFREILAKNVARK